MSSSNSEYKDFTVVVLLSYLLFSVCGQNIREDLRTHPNWQLLNREDDCGHSVAERIIGGKVATLGQYPWIARLGYTFELDEGSPIADVYECGGTIISERYILTAAHCSPEVVGIKLLQVQLGEYDSTKDVDCMNGVCAPPVQDIDVEEYICHPDYIQQSYLNDICIIRLASPIQFNNYVSPICLPMYDIFQNATFEGEKMEVAGWGIVDIDTGKQSDILMTLKVPIVPFQQCAIQYSGKADLISSQMCAGGIIGEDSCSGDSGGPLMKPMSIQAPPRYFVIGVVSFGPKDCAASDTPGVYTIVAHYMDWILNNIRK